MAVTYTTSAPVNGVDKKYKGAYGPINSQKFSIAPCGVARKAVVCLLTASGTYTAGGDAITIADLPISQVHAAYAIIDDATGASQAAATAIGKYPQFDLSNPAAPKLKWYSAASTEDSGSITGRTLLVRLEGV